MASSAEYELFTISSEVPELVNLNKEGFSDAMVKFLYTSSFQIVAMHNCYGSFDKAMVFPY